MKTLRAILAVLLCCLAARAADDGRVLKVTGIAQIAGSPVVLVEARPMLGGTVKPILSVNEAVEGFQLTAINPQKARATFKFRDRTIEVPLGSVAEFADFKADPPPTFHFKDADARQVLELYQQASGRTVILSPSLPAATVSLKSEPGLSRAASLEVLEKVLRDQGVIVTPRYDRFAFATSISHVPRLAQIPEPPAPAPPPAPAKEKENKDPKDGKDTKEEVFPPGLIKFHEADRAAVLEIYQELTGRTLLVSPDLPPAKITVKTQTPLTRAEAVWLVEALLYLGTIKTVPEWTKFTYVLPATRGVAAPKIPDHPAADQLKGSKEGLVRGKLHFREATADQVLGVYAALLGREPAPIPRNTPAVRFTLKNQTDLHPVEAIYALDALAELHHLRFVLVGDKQVKIVHVSEAGNADAGKTR